MKVKIIAEYGHMEALFGIGLSYGLTSKLDFEDFKNIYTAAHCISNIESHSILMRLEKIASNIALNDGGHNKFLESISVWIDILAPRYWWQQMDSYRIGITKQSESTIRLLPKKTLTQDNFEGGIPDNILKILNEMIILKDIYNMKRILPESYLQRRIVATNYKALRTIIVQREKDFLPEWKYFKKEILDSIQRQEWIV